MLRKDIIETVAVLDSSILLLSGISVVGIARESEAGGHEISSLTFLWPLGWCTCVHLQFHCVALVVSHKGFVPAVLQLLLLFVDVLLLLVVLVHHGA
jgi:hypothetical protein